MTPGEFYKKSFSGKIRADILLLIPLVIVGAMLVSVLIVSLIQGKDFAAYWSRSIYSLPLTILLSLLSGPTGEESGWRGYLRCELERKYGFLNAVVYLGVIWAFWHTFYIRFYQRRYFVLCGNVRNVCRNSDMRICGGQRSWQNESITFNMRLL